MDLFLNEQEQEELENLGDQFSYAQLLWNIALPTDQKNKFRVEKSDAWAWKEVVDGERGFLPKARGTLKAKLQKLYEAIN